MKKNRMLPILEPYTLFLVDMDDTLYEERDFVMSGFKAVAKQVERWGIQPDTAFDYLRKRFDAMGRHHIFDHLLNQYAADARAERVHELVQIYRNHIPHIRLYSGVAPVLDAMRAKGRVVVVTDGLAPVQERKFNALGLGAMVDRVVFCQAAGYAKPDPRSLDGVVAPGARDAVLIGDNPEHDLCMADRLGIDAIRVRTGRFRKVSNRPWRPVADLEQFASLRRSEQTTHR